MIFASLISHALYSSREASLSQPLPVAGLMCAAAATSFAHTNEGSPSPPLYFSLSFFLSLHTAA